MLGLLDEFLIWTRLQKGVSNWASIFSLVEVAAMNVLRLHLVLCAFSSPVIDLGRRPGLRITGSQPESPSVHLHYVHWPGQ